MSNEPEELDDLDEEDLEGLLKNIPGLCHHKNVSLMEGEYEGCVRHLRPDLCDPRAHGGIFVSMVCSDCDCNRILNINGEFIESSRWIYLSDEVSYYSTWAEVSNVA